MSSFRLVSDLAAFMVPFGIIGAALATVCAIVAGVAIIRGAGGLSGGAVGIWIPCALMSFTASIVDQWLPLAVSVAALAAMLVIGGVVRSILSAVGGDQSGRRPSWQTRHTEEAASGAPLGPVAASVAVPATTP